MGEVKADMLLNQRDFLQRSLNRCCVSHAKLLAEVLDKSTNCVIPTCANLQPYPLCRLSGTVETHMHALMCVVSPELVNANSEAVSCQACLGLHSAGCCEYVTLWHICCNCFWTSCAIGKAIFPTPEMWSSDTLS